MVGQKIQFKKMFKKRLKPEEITHCPIVWLLYRVGRSTIQMGCVCYPGWVAHADQFYTFKKLLMSIHYSLYIAHFRVS